MPYKCDRECFNRNDDGWCKDEWCRNPVPSVPYGAVYRHTDYAEDWIFADLDTIIDCYSEPKEAEGEE